MSSFDGRRSVEDQSVTIKNYEGFGELVTGGGDTTKILYVGLCMLNNPVVNQYLLDNKLKLQDRITKTTIFPREGMALPNGEVYHSPKVEEPSLSAPENTENV